jgi:hypothetical protein
LFFLAVTGINMCGDQSALGWELQPMELYGMKKLLFATAALVALAGPASADIVYTAGQGGFDTLNFSGITNPDLTATITFDLLSVNYDENAWLFNYTVANTTDPLLASRISTWGFNTNPALIGANVTGQVFDDYVLHSVNSIPQLQMAVDFCATTGSDNCNNSQGGVFSGGSTFGTFTLDFDGSATINQTQITLSDFYVRYQSVGYNGDTSGSDTGVPVGVPGPIAGAGLPGLISACLTLLGFQRWRRRRQLMA